MRDILVSATIPFGLATSAAWTAFLAFELFRWVASLFWGCTPRLGNVRTGSISPATRIVAVCQPGSDGAFAVEHPLPAAPCAPAGRTGWRCPKTFDRNS